MGLFGMSFLPTQRIDYPKVMEHFFVEEDKWNNIFPTVFPQWDRTPRAGNSEGVYIDATPENFKKHLEKALNYIDHKPDDKKVLFLRSWNEWGEGNYVEPDTKYGHGFLDAIKETITT